MTYDPADTGPNDSDADLGYTLDDLNNVHFLSPGDVTQSAVDDAGEGAKIILHPNKTYTFSGITPKDAQTWEGASAGWDLGDKTLTGDSTNQTKGIQGTVIDPGDQTANVFETSGGIHGFTLCNLAFSNCRAACSFGSSSEFVYSGLFDNIYGYKIGHSVLDLENPILIQIGHIQALSTSRLWYLTSSEGVPCGNFQVGHVFVDGDGAPTAVSDGMYAFDQTGTGGRFNMINIDRIQAINAPTGLNAGIWSNGIIDNSQFDGINMELSGATHVIESTGTFEHSSLAFGEVNGTVYDFDTIRGCHIFHPQLDNPTITIATSNRDNFWIVGNADPTTSDFQGAGFNIAADKFLTNQNEFLSSGRIPDDTDLRFGSTVDSGLRNSSTNDRLELKVQGTKLATFREFPDVQWEGAHLMQDNPVLDVTDMGYGAQRSSDPGTGDLDDGESMTYISDGTAGVTGAEGDLVWATNDGGSIKTLVLGAVSSAS